MILFQITKIEPLHHWMQNDAKMQFLVNIRQRFLNLDLLDFRINMIMILSFQNIPNLHCIFKKFNVKNAMLLSSNLLILFQITKFFSLHHWMQKDAKMQFGKYSAKSWTGIYGIKRIKIPEAIFFPICIASSK